MVQALERTMGRKKQGESDRRDDVAVKVDRTLVDKARLVASRKGVTMAEYLTDLLRGPVEKEFTKAVRELEAGPK